MVENLKLFKLVDGVQTPFPNEDSQIEIFDYTYNAKRMGGAPSISATVKYANCLDDVWTESVYVEFNGEKYFLKQTPTSSYSSDDARYKHDLELVSERIILDNVYFYDVVSADFNDYKPVTDSTKVIFFGNISEFVARLNESLKYAKLQKVENGTIQGYNVVIDNGITSEAKLITFEDQFFSGVLQEIFKVYELPYYFVGKTIHIGFEPTQGVVMPTFQYGIDNELLSITKTNANNKIVNRVTGQGSADNIPYYYPNMSEKGDLKAKYYTTDGQGLVQVDNVIITNGYVYGKKVDTDTSLVYTEATPEASFDSENILFRTTSEKKGEGAFAPINNQGTIYCNFPNVSTSLWITLRKQLVVRKSGRIEIPAQIIQYDTSNNPVNKLSEINSIELFNLDGEVTSVGIHVEDDKIVIPNAPTNNASYILQIIYDVKYMGYTTSYGGRDYKVKVNIGNPIGITEKYWLDEDNKNKYQELVQLGLRLKEGVTPKLGDKIIQEKTAYIQPQETLMPSIYRNSGGNERFYNATNLSAVNLLVNSADVLEIKSHLLGTYECGAISPKNGDKVTLSFSGYLGTGHGAFKIFNNKTVSPLTTITRADFNSTTRRFEKTITWVDTSYNNTNTPTISIYQVKADGTSYTDGEYATNSELGASKIYDAKLEFGESATLYSPYDESAESYIDEETGTFYEFANPYVEGKPKEQIVQFEDIKPTITGITNFNGQRIDMFSEFAYDENDNDEMEEIDGNLVYKHPYFFGKLRKMNGKHSFNLFDSAIDEGEMTISMTSGHCGGCNFRVMVSEDDLKQNTVQVYETDVRDSTGTIIHRKGELKRDEKGNVLCGRENYQSPVKGQAMQQDTTNNEVWIALEKDLETYGTVMPSRVVDANNFATTIRPSVEDTFVILHINLPHAYITAAEEKLEKEIIKYMKDNNDEKFTFSIKFSRIYLADNPDVASAINENALLNVKYNEHTYPLYVSSYSYKMSSSEALPEITVELKDEITVNQNALQNAISEVKGDFQTAFKNLDIFSLCGPYFLRKDADDRSSGKISASMGFEAGGYVKGRSGAKIDEYGQAEVENINARSSVISNEFVTQDYVSGILGSGAKLWIDENNKANFEVDKITARESFKVTELIVQKVNSVGGVLVVSATNGEIKEIITNYAQNTGEIESYTVTFGTDSTFEQGDIIRCSYWDNESTDENKLRNYWVAISVADSTKKNVITIPATYTDSKGETILVQPKVGDKVAQMGNTTNNKRQGVIVISTENNKPFIGIYDGVNTNALNTDKLRGRFGDLSGITFNGKKLTGYGIWSNNAYLNGELIVRNGQTIEDAIASQAASKNLLLGTNKGVTNWSFSSSLYTYTTKEISYNGASGVQIIKNNPLESAGWEIIKYPLRPELIKKDKKYHLTFDFMQSAENEIELGFSVSLNNTNGNNPLTNAVSLKSKNIGGIWQHFDAELIATANGVQNDGRIVYFNIQRSTNGWKDLAIVNLKLEEGEISTAWSPAPEDGVETELKVLEDRIVAKVGNTGINIETGEINVSADKFTITNSDGKVTAGADESGNWSTNALHTKDSEGKKAITINEDNNNMQRFYYPNTDKIQMEMGWDANTASLMRYYDIEGNMLWQIGSEKGFMTGSSSDTIIRTFDDEYSFLGTFDSTTPRLAFLAAANEALYSTSISGKSYGDSMVLDNFYFDAYLSQPVNGYLADLRYTEHEDGRAYRNIMKVVDGYQTAHAIAWLGSGDYDIPEDWLNG